jgi:hypothetical protein
MVRIGKQKKPDAANESASRVKSMPDPAHWEKIDNQ